MTELDAVNEMLGVIGEPPVNTLEVIENVDVANALRILHKTSRYVQSKGWAWNTWTSYLLILMSIQIESGGLIIFYYW